MHIYNNLSKQKEPFTPIDPQRVRMYVCGMTVYDLCHVGHARALVVFDLVYRYLCRLYGADHVSYVRNITDIDDKIIKRAAENGEPVDQLTQRYIEEMDRDADALRVLRPNEEPRATHYMDQIIAMIKVLEQKGFAYAAANGDVYYSVSKFAHYGQLSGRQLQDLRAGERVDVDEAKVDALDFVLWKSAKPGEPSWESPWGSGRPGWHIECSAMSTQCLGDHFDIHGGGLDLQFPHHENEIAQSEAATGRKFANVWMHNGHVRVDNEKMSKSLGNFFTIREVLQQYDAEVMRFFILNSHYRSPLNYSDQHLDQAKESLRTLYQTLRGISPEGSMKRVQGMDIATESPYAQRFYAALDDDFNTPKAFSVLFDLSRELNRVRETDTQQAKALGGELLALGGLLGLLQQDPEQYLQGGEHAGGLDNEAVDQLIQHRNEARATKNWAESDRIRDLLAADGIVLEDAAEGTRWRRE